MARGRAWRMLVSEEARMTTVFTAQRHEARSRPVLSKSRPFDLRPLPFGMVPRVAAVAGLLYLLAPPAFGQTDPGVRGGLQNTAGYLQYRRIQIPHPPVISPNPTTGATITA